MTAKSRSVCNRCFRSGYLENKPPYGYLCQSCQYDQRIWEREETLEATARITMIRENMSPYTGQSLSSILKGKNDDNLRSDQEEQ